MKAAAAGAALHSSLCHLTPNSFQSKSTSPLTPKPQSLLQKHPLYSSTHTNLSLQFKEKVLCLEIMGLDSGKALSQNPSLLTASLHSIHSIISFLQSKGIQYKDMPRILGMCPKILTCSISSDLIPVFNFLAQDLKVPEQNFRGVINKCPRLLISCVKDQLKPALLYLRRLGFKDLEALAYQDPVLLVSSVENTLIPKLNYLTEQGGFSRSDAVSMVLRCPAFFTFSVENNFKPKLEYFENVMKGDKSELREFPQYFAFSLEKRIKPRYEQIVKLGINKMPLSAMLKMTDEEWGQTSPQSNGFHSNGSSFFRDKVQNHGEQCMHGSLPFRNVHRPFYYGTSSVLEVQLDPFSLVADELSLVTDRLREMVVSEVPKLALAAEYFFKAGVDGKRFRPTVLLLMATALNVSVPEIAEKGIVNNFYTELRGRQQRIAEITEMVHVASLLHDDVLDDADIRRGVGSLNSVMGNKFAVLAGNFLLSRACLSLASLKNNEVVTLISTAIKHLVTGETMQMTTESDQRYSMEYYLEKTYCKTASLISNSCKSVAVLAGQPADVAILAFEYGKNLGLAYQLIDDVLDFTGTSASLGKGPLSDIQHGIVTAPILYAIEEFPELRKVVDRGFEDPANVNEALKYLEKSRGVQRTRELAVAHACLAAQAIDSLPRSRNEDVITSRLALVDLTQRAIARTK
ncbi:unnamed protein product [Rhodiola kirilowii]